MNLDFFLLNGYGQFVWPAFIITFFICFALYFKTYKEFKKYEKLYLNEFRQKQSAKIEDFDSKETLSRSTIF